jgi:hypothetical protein
MGWLTRTGSVVNGPPILLPRGEAHHGTLLRPEGRRGSHLCGLSREVHAGDVVEEEIVLEGEEFADAAEQALFQRRLVGRQPSKAR